MENYATLSESMNNRHFDEKVLAADWGEQNSFTNAYMIQQLIPLRITEHHGLHYYHTLLKYWQEYNHDKFSKNIDIPNKIIWINSRILIGGKPTFYKPLFQAQVISIKHLLNENNTFLSFDELKQKVNINIPFTLYYGLITSIPTEWKKILRNQNNCAQTVNSTLVPLQDPPSTRTAYSFLLNKAIRPPTSENRILNYGFTKGNIHKVYTFPFLIT